MTLQEASGGYTISPTPWTSVTSSRSRLPGYVPPPGSCPWGFCTSFIFPVSHPPTLHLSCSLEPCLTLTTTWVPLLLWTYHQFPLELEPGSQLILTLSPSHNPFPSLSLCSCDWALASHSCQPWPPAASVLSACLPFTFRSSVSVTPTSWPWQYPVSLLPLTFSAVLFQLSLKSQILLLRRNLHTVKFFFLMYSSVVFAHAWILVMITMDRIRNSSNAPKNPCALTLYSDFSHP